MRKGKSHPNYANFFISVATVKYQLIIWPMNFVTQRGSIIFYEEFGSPTNPPLLLIHGSTLTGNADFCVESNIAQRFAKNYRVIVPDCPGHGKSPAEWLSKDMPRYSFTSMAADLAELLLGLNAAPAFVFGHSNGGTVALYMAKEQSQQVRAAILLAANAYIDEHIRTRVPIGMDAERVAHEEQQWLDEMIRLHDVHQGEGYWRQLLAATVTETITNPDWQQADLQHVQVPCLCVQGENDRVNVPGRHAQTLAAWLPNSELWLPAGLGHSVHWEAPDTFEQRARAFFAI